MKKPSLRRDTPVTPVTIHENRSVQYGNYNDLPFDNIAIQQGYNDDMELNYMVVDNPIFKNYAEMVHTFWEEHLSPLSHTKKVVCTYVIIFLIFINITKINSSI